MIKNTFRFFFYLRIEMFFQRSSLRAYRLHVSNRDVPLVTGRTGCRLLLKTSKLSLVQKKKKKKKKKSLWKWPDVTLPQCLPPHNSAAAWGEPDWLSGPEYNKNIEKNRKKLLKHAIEGRKERGAVAWALPRRVCGPVRDGRLPGLHVRLTNAVLETFWWVNYSFFR